MKNLIRTIAILFAGVSVATACVKDLNTVPLNPYDAVSETVYGTDEAGYVSGLSRIYFQFVSCDLTDLQLSDGGASELVRAYWSVNEMSTDEGKCAWSNDPWVYAVNTNTWSDADNDATYAIYVRTMQGIAFANEYLRQTSADKLSARGVDAELSSKIDGFRAEVRFLRAYLYWMAMDTFGDVPFTTEDSPFGGGINPKQAARADVFKFCVSELEELAGDGSAMPAAKSNYPRADKGSVLGLLARLYLNAEVYSGTAMWNEAKQTCERIFGLGYAASPVYSDLFRGDNGENASARGEFLWALPYDAEDTQSWGGSTYMNFAAINADVDAPLHINGVNNGWGGIRTTYEFAQMFFDVANPDYSTGTYDCKDKRGQLFRISGRTESMKDAMDVFLNGWSVLKFNNIPHDKTAEEYAEMSGTKGFSDIDFPMIRLGEIYLIYAEACLNTNHVADALPYLKILSERAGVEAPVTVTKDFLVAERARELFWEGHRRTDLIRWGLFNSGSFLWPFKGGPYAGQGFDAHLNIFAIPASELASNTELVQNPGYGA